MPEQEIYKARKSLIVDSRKVLWWIIIAIILIILLPIIFTQFSWKISFIGKGEIGDVIGGVTAPVIGLLSAYLVYKAFIAQIKANEQVQKQIADDRIFREDQIKLQSIIYSVDRIEKELERFSYISEQLRGGRKFIGPEAIPEVLNEHLFLELACSKDFVKNTEEIKLNLSTASYFPYRLSLSLKKIDNIQSEEIKNYAKEYAYEFISRAILPTFSHFFKYNDRIIPKCSKCNKPHPSIPYTFFESYLFICKTYKTKP